MNTWKVGLPLTEDHKKKLSLLMTANNPTHRVGVAKKISESNKGRNVWNKGKIEWKNCLICGNQIRSWRKYCSILCRSKSSQMAAPITKYVKEIGPWNKGMVMSQDFRDKCSKTHCQKWELDTDYKNKAASNLRKNLSVRPTKLEKEMIKIINKNKLPYKYVGDNQLFIGRKNPDFVHTGLEKKLIEVGNVYHHKDGYAEGRKKYYEGYGWQVSVFIADKLDEQLVLNTLIGGERT